MKHDDMYPSQYQKLGYEKPVITKDMRDKEKAVADGFLIPGEVMQGNCVKVFLDDKLYAVVKNETAALALIRMIDAYVSVPVKSTYQLAYIENIGF